MKGLTEDEANTIQIISAFVNEMRYGSKSIKDTVEKLTANDDVAAIDGLLKFEAYPATIGIELVSINGSTGAVSGNSSCRTVYVSCSPNTVYKIRKIAGQRFAVGSSTVAPKANNTLTKYTEDATAEEIVFQTDKTAKYLCAFVYYQTTDSPITAAEMVASVQISVLIPVCSLNNEYRLRIGNRSIYNNVNLPFFAYSKANDRLSGHALQSVVKKGNDLVVFTSEPSAVMVRNQHGFFSQKERPELSHVMSAELLDDGSILVVSTDENDARKIFFYDLESNAISDAFEPSVSGNLVFASQLSPNTFYLITWISTSNNLHFYTYDRDLDTAKEVGSRIIDRTFLQGGSRVNDLLYLSMNDGWYGKTNAMVQVMNKDSLEVVDTITLSGFGEVEGFDVKCEGKNTLAYFSDSNIHTLFCAKLS